MEKSNHRQLAVLARAARNGDVEAYGRIVVLTREAVESAARQVLHDPDDAEDVAQETYLRAFHKIADLKDASTLVAWLLRTARNLALNRLRGQRWSFVRDMEVPDVATQSPVDDGAAGLVHAMARLNADDRRLCERYYHGGWQTARLAADAGVSEAAIRKRLQRTRDRLKREMSMERTDLPQRVVELLSRPNLTVLPENPVGAIWEEFRRRFEGFTEVDLPEKLEPEEVREVFGDAPSIEDHLAYVSRQQWLRRELTMPMLVAARGRGAPVRMIATGKTYRIGNGEETATHLHAFHQAEVLWIEEGVSEWRIFDLFADFVTDLCADARLRIEQTDFSPQCERGWTVSAEWPGKDWSSISGWGRITSDVVSRLGFDPSRVTAVGLGVGLERLAQLRYGIGDIRMVAAETV